MSEQRNKHDIIEAMKHEQHDMVEGMTAFTRFENAMKKVLSVPHSEIQRRIEEHKKEAALNPKKRGPKPRGESGASRVPPA